MPPPAALPCLTNIISSAPFNQALRGPQPDAILHGMSADRVDAALCIGAAVASLPAWLLWEGLRTINWQERGLGAGECVFFFFGPLAVVFVMIGIALLVGACKRMSERKDYSRVELLYLAAAALASPWVAMAYDYLKPH